MLAATVVSPFLTHLLVFLLLDLRIDLDLNGIPGMEDVNDRILWFNSTPLYIYFL